MAEDLEPLAEHAANRLERLARRIRAEVTEVCEFSEARQVLGVINWTDQKAMEYEFTPEVHIALHILDPQDGG